MEEFEGFLVLVPGAMTVQCAKYVPELSITMGTYTLTGHFFVDIPDTNVILGVQWLITLGRFTTNWKTLEMEWIEGKNGKHQKIKGINTYPPQIVSTHIMEADLRRGDIEWVVELHLSKAGGKDSLVHPDNLFWISILQYLEIFHQEGLLTGCLNTLLSWSNEYKQ